MRGHHGKSAHLLEHRQGLQLWVESTREVSRSGKTENFENAVRVLARRIGETIDFDALILASLYLQNARLREDGLARWDGANQKIEFIGRARGEIEMPPLATISAVSLLLYVFDRNGNAIHSKRTGLELIQHMEIQSVPRKGRDKKSWILTDDGEAIEDPDRLAAAIAHALYPFLPKSTR